MKLLENGQNQSKFAQIQIKFQEIMEKVEEDRISALPDCLLVDILSRLPSTREAIRTGTLSKRWKHVWTSVSSLIFTVSDFPLSSSDVILDIDKTLNQCRQLKLKKFKLDVMYCSGFGSFSRNWIRYAISRNVEDLNLEFHYIGGADESLLDHSFFITSCFVDLRLSGIIVNPTGAISWTNLRTLCLSSMNLNEDLIVNILSGSPLLEVLAFEDCYSNDSDDEVSDISKLSQCPQLNLKKFKVITDSQVFPFNSQLNNWIHYVIRCNVEELHLQFFGSKFIPDQILFTTSCFTDLTLNGYMLYQVGVISWTSLRSLCLLCCMHLNEDLIENILSGSPVLETLVLDDCCGYRRLNITSKSVKNLVLSGYQNVGRVDIIEINAPNILSLIIKENVMLRKILLLNMSSLVKANLNYTSIKWFTTREEEEEDLFKEIIQNLRHVKEVEIGFCCFEVFSQLQAKGFTFQSNVKLTGVD